MHRGWLTALAILVGCGCASTPAGGPGPSRDGGPPASDGAPSTGPDASGRAGDASLPPADAGPATPPAPPPITGIDYAPYFPTWAWDAGFAFTSLVDLQKKSGLQEVTLAFVLADNGCKTDRDVIGHLDDIKAFVAAGGHVKASFGGAEGVYLESRCPDAAALAGALTAFVDTTGITDLDFDIEQAKTLTEAMNEMRAQALAMVQKTRGIQVAFTLAADPHGDGATGGLLATGQSVVKHALAAGVRVVHVNLMTMDYGDEFQGMPLAPVAIGSLTDAHAQLMRLDPSLTSEKAWGMLGVIPMIGHNDDAEVFSLADAAALAKFATDNKLGLVSFWSVDRDQVCGPSKDPNVCSTVNSAPFEFTHAFAAVRR